MSSCGLLLFFTVSLFVKVPMTEPTELDEWFKVKLYSDTSGLTEAILYLEVFEVSLSA